MATNPPIVIGPFANVPAPGSGVKSDWPQQISTFVTALPRGVIGAHQLATAFATVAPHTNYQDTGLTLTFTPVAGRRYKFTLMVNPYTPGGVQDVLYQVIAGAALLRAWNLSGMSGSGEHAHTLQHTAILGALGSTVFKVQIKGAGANTSVTDYGNASEPRQFLIEDIGAV
jgi:hypothetical protein